MAPNRKSLILQKTEEKGFGKTIRTTTTTTERRGEKRGLKFPRSTKIKELFLLCLISSQRAWWRKAMRIGFIGEEIHPHIELLYASKIKQKESVAKLHAKTTTFSAFVAIFWVSK